MMKNSSVPLLIVGAGPAGMGAAFQAHRRGIKFMLVEKGNQIGGAGRTLKFGEFSSDIGIHIFFGRDREVMETIKIIAGDNITPVEGVAKLFINNRAHPGPLGPANIFKVFGVKTGIRAAAGFALRTIKNLFSYSPCESLERNIISIYGETLGGFILLNRLRKIWGAYADKIHHELFKASPPRWSACRIARTGLRPAGFLLGKISSIIAKPGSVDGVKHALLRNRYVRGVRSKMAMSSFSGRSGNQSVYNAIVSYISGNDNNDRCISTSSSVESLRFDSNDGHVRVVIRFDGADKVSEIKVGSVIWTAPAASLLRVIQPSVHGDLVSAAKMLSFRSHVAVLMTFDHKNTILSGDTEFIEILDRSIPIFRVSEPKKICPDTAPQGKTSLLVEYYCDSHDWIFNLSDEELYRVTFSNLVKMDIINRTDACNYHSFRTRSAIPVFDKEYHRFFLKARGHLARFKNLAFSGQFDRDHCVMYQVESFRMGMNLTDHIHKQKK